MKKIKIVQCSKDHWWYFGREGQIFEVEEEKVLSDGLNYYVRFDGNHSGAILATDVEIINFMHNGKEYILPNWAKYVTCDGESFSLWAWEHKPEEHLRETDGKFYYYTVSGARAVIKEKPVKPAGAFLKEVV